MTPGEWDRLVDELTQAQERRRELERRLAEFVHAFDAGAVEMRSASILPDGQASPHPWHEEWLAQVRALISDGKKGHG